MGDGHKLSVACLFANKREYERSQLKYERQEVKVASIRDRCHRPKNYNKREHSLLKSCRHL